MARNNTIPSTTWTRASDSLVSHLRKVLGIKGNSLKSASDEKRVIIKNRISIDKEVFDKLSDKKKKYIDAEIEAEALLK